MPKITSVEPQKISANPETIGANRRTHRFNIFIDGGFAFGADEDLVVEYRLVPGKILTTPDVEQLLFEAEVGKLMERMYRLWNVRARSEKEVRDYLKNLSFKRKVKDQEEISAASIDLLITKLKQKRLLSDKDFAKAWVEARRKSKLKGKIALKQELFQKGIDKEIIDEVLGNEDVIYSEDQLAQQVLEKKWKNLEPLPYLEKKKKSFEFLTRRGFEYDIVKETVEKFLRKV